MTSTSARSLRPHCRVVRIAAIWLRSVQRPVVIELGAGTAVPSVRMFAESVRGPLIRINLDESEVVHEGVGIRGTALDVLSAIDALLVKA